MTSPHGWPRRAERRVLNALEGGCQAPIGALATWTAPGRLHLAGIVAGVDGLHLLRAAEERPVADESAALALGESVAAMLASQGARGLIEQARQLAGAGGPGMSPRAPLVVATREEQADDGFVRLLREAGVQSFALPTISIGPPRDPGPLTEAIERLPSTPSGSCSRARTRSPPPVGTPRWAAIWRTLAARPRIAAIGPATAARLQHVRADVRPHAGPLERR